MIRLPPSGPLAFAAATLVPLALLGAGLAGVVPAAAGLLYMACLVPALDLLARADAAPEGTEFPGSDALLVALALGHLALLPATVAGVAGGGGLPPGARLALAQVPPLWRRVMPPASRPAERGLVTGHGRQGLAGLQRSGGFRCVPFSSPWR